MKRLTALPLALLLAAPAFAFDSGSTGTDGAFTPVVDTTLPLPADGVFNFTDIDIPTGVTVRFARNATNTPVTLLVSGNVNIAGTIDLDGDAAAATGTANDGVLGDDGNPGTGGPGGFDGGHGGAANQTELAPGGAGLGPGGGRGGVVWQIYTPTSGSGAGHATDGEVTWDSSYRGVLPGKSYGSPTLLPLIGGSGGGGGSGGRVMGGAGGGGGGGAILIAASGTTNITGAILARGGRGGDTGGIEAGTGGSGGSGGAVRIVTTRLEGNGSITASGGGFGYAPEHRFYGAAGAPGRIRLETEEMIRTATTIPEYTFSDPGPVFIAGLPSLRITRIAGVDVPAQPTGSADVTLPADTVNPVTVELATTGVPVGNTVKVTVTPATGTISSVISPALDGAIDNASASVAVDLPSGRSTLMAETTYTIVAALGDTLAPLAGGERVERVRLTAALNGPGTVTLITVSGKEYTHRADKVPLMPAV